MNTLVLIGVTSLGITALLTLWAAVYGSHHGGQSMRESIIESWSNIAIGFGINYAANLIVLPLAGLPVSASGAFWIGAIFTGISVLRSFALRRWFNKRLLNRPASANTTGITGNNWHKPAQKADNTPPLA